MLATLIGFTFLTIAIIWALATDFSATTALAYGFGMTVFAIFGIGLVILSRPSVLAIGLGILLSTCGLLLYDNQINRRKIKPELTQALILLGVAILLTQQPL
jgi:hypothetical protein